MPARPTVTVTAELTITRAEALAMYIKRLTLSDLASKCSQAERFDGLAYEMQDALDDVAKALQQLGFRPR